MHSIRILAGAGLLLAALAARADVTLPRIFGDYMVVQQDAKIPVWGTADPKELVQVSLGKVQLRTQADAQGNWRVEFDALPAGTPPMTLAVGGRNGIEIHDIVVGEVWLLAGDSNVGYRIAEEPNSKDLLAQPADPMLRFYLLDNRPGIRPKTSNNGYWCPSAQPWLPNLSALAYLYGQQLRQKLNRPVGVIVGSWGGIPIEGWMSREALQKFPGHEKQLADVAAREAVFPRDPEQQKAAMDDFGKRMHDWDQNQNHPWIDAENAWSKARDAAVAAKQPVPPEPPPRAPAPRSPDGEPDDVTVLYNGLIAPLTNTPVRGVAWFQGEGNTGSTEARFQPMLRALIDDWRGKWKADLPFIVVDLPDAGPRATKPENSGWAEVRGAQIAVAASTPKAGLAQSLDLAPSNNTYFPDKLDLGKRIAATALHDVYGQAVPFDGPRFAGMAVEGNKVRIKYANPDAGLVLAAGPFASPVDPPLPLNEPLGFEIAGADKKWVSAKAQIDGSTMLVWADGVAAPVAVRYAWAGNPPLNLYSKDGFPAVPFRTQDWNVNP